MRSLLRRPLPSRSLAAALVVLLATTACEREITRDEARPAGPQLAKTSATYASTGYLDVRAMNASGAIVGENGAYGYFWKMGAEKRPLYLSASDRSMARDINDAGTVVGTLRQQGISRLMLWSEAGGMVVVPLPEGWTGAQGYAINEAGVVAGSAFLADSSRRTFRWSAATGMQLLPRAYSGSDIPASSYYEGTYDINEAGDILGNFGHRCVPGWPVPCFRGYWQGAVVWTAAGGLRSLPGRRDLAVYAWDLSEGGVAVGCDNGEPMLWTATGARQALGAPGQPGCAAAINEAGVVVGQLNDLAFRWSAAEGMQTLGTLGGSFSRAHDINEAGDITGGATLSTPGYYRPFLWTPEGRMQMLPPLPGATEPSEGLLINEAREVAGQHWLWGMFWSNIVVNRAPVAHAGGPYTGRISGRRYVYDASGTVDVDGTRLRYSWDMNGDDVFDAVTNAPLLGYTYPAGGSYTVRLVVLDDGGTADTTFTTARVAQNVAPIAVVTGMPTSRGEGLPITLTPSVRDANQAVDGTELSLLRYRWDWGDGYISTARISSHAYADRGTYPVRLIVTDAGGLADTVDRTAVIGNLPPRVTASATSPTTFAVGGALSLDATFTDMANDAPWRYRIYWGDGAYTVLTPVAAGATITGSHVYRKPGTFAAYVGVVDKDGGSGRSAPIAVTVTP